MSRTPHYVGRHAFAFADLFAWPDLHARQQRRARAQNGVFAQHAFLKRGRFRPHASAVDEHAGAQLAAFLRASALPQHAAFDANARAHLGVRADHTIRPDTRARADHCVFSDEARGFQNGGAIHARALGAEHAAGARGQGQADFPIQRVAMRAQVRARVADVAPVAVHGQREDGFALFYQTRKQFAPKIVGAPVGNVGEDFRF